MANKMQDHPGGAVLTERFEARLTEDEGRMLAEMAATEFPESARARSLMMRRLIREGYYHRKTVQEYIPE